MSAAAGDAGGGGCGGRLRRRQDRITVIWASRQAAKLAVLPVDIIKETLSWGPTRPYQLPYHSGHTSTDTHWPALARAAGAKPTSYYLHINTHDRTRVAWLLVVNSMRPDACSAQLARTVSIPFRCCVLDCPSAAHVTA